MKNIQNENKAKCQRRKGSVNKSRKQGLKTLTEQDLLSIGEMSQDNGAKGKAQGCWYECIPNLPKAKK